MSLPEIRTAEISERDAVVATLTLAFAGDPFNRWYLPEADRYLTHFPKIAAELAKPALEAGTCFVTPDFGGTALWYPPGVGPDEEALEQIFVQAPPAQLAEPLGALLVQFEHHHPKDEDCWYLPLIGVDPAFQGQGLGGALMKHATRLIDEQGALSYLESSTPQNISLYQRHGFDVTAELAFGEKGDIASPMLRARRSA